jgi:F-type H+-transporting ATPase subunit gamma
MANRRTVRFIRDAEEHGVAVRAVVKGLKGEAPVRRRTDADLVHVEGWSRAGVTEEDVTRLGDLLVEPFLAGEVQEVWTTYTEFHSPLLRTTRTQRLLPIGLGRIEGVPAGAVDGDAAWWSHEPEAREVLHALVEAFVLVQVEEVLLQSYASEQGARMITMEEATERADKTLQECHVQFNRLRRESITTDLLGSLFATSLRQAEETPVAAGRGV